MFVLLSFICCCCCCCLFAFYLYRRKSVRHTTVCGQKETEGGEKMSSFPAVKNITWERENCQRLVIAFLIVYGVFQNRVKFCLKIPHSVRLYRRLVP